MKSKIKTIIFVVLGIMLSYYMSNIFTQILSPKLQFFVDASKYCEDNSLQIFRYDKEGEDVKSADGINYNYETTYGEKRIKLKFQFLNNNVIDCHINDYKNDNIKNISKYTTVAGYSNVFCIITDIVDAKHNIIWGFLFIVFLVGELYVALKIIKRKCDPYWLIYSKTSLDYIGIKPIVFSFIITVAIKIVIRNILPEKMLNFTDNYLDKQRGVLNKNIIYDNIYRNIVRRRGIILMIENNRSDYEKEREARERRLRAYAEEIQKQILGSSGEIVHQLVEERHNQGLTQSDMAELTGMMASNIARFENGGRVPTLLVLQKYAGALGKHIELKVCDNME